MNATKNVNDALHEQRVTRAIQDAVTKLNSELALADAEGFRFALSVTGAAVRVVVYDEKRACGNVRGPYRCTKPTGHIDDHANSVQSWGQFTERSEVQK